MLGPTDTHDIDDTFLDEVSITCEQWNGITHCALTWAHVSVVFRNQFLMLMLQVSCIIVNEILKFHYIS